jgi:hypothetical protein
MEKGKVTVKNPFREEGSISDKVFVDVLQTACLNKRNGLMFKLFDIGNMSFSDAKLLTYRNIVGNSVRKFLAVCRSRDSMEQELEHLKSDILRIVRLSDNDQEFLRAFTDSVEAVCREFINTVDNELLVAKAVGKDSE